MDIAEIRKKAQAQAKSKGEDAAPVQDSQLPVVPEADVTVGEPPDEVMTAVPDLVQESSSQDFNSGLDRLFAVTEEFALATDESYSELLEAQADAEDQVSSQYLAFNLGKEEYALDIKRISEIIKVREFTDIPRAPEFILGIISLRGVVVPVYDLRLRLNLGTSGILPTSRIVVCQLDDVSVGLLVDSINQVVKLVDRDLEPPPGVLSGLDREMVNGIGRYQGRMIILLNLKSVLEVEV